MTMSVLSATANKPIVYNLIFG